MNGAVSNFPRFKSTNLLRQVGVIFLFGGLGESVVPRNAVVNAVEEGAPSRRSDQRGDSDGRGPVVDVRFHGADQGSHFVYSLSVVELLNRWSKTELEKSICFNLNKLKLLNYKLPPC